MNGGTISTGNFGLIAGNSGVGTLNMRGGTINSFGNLWIPQQASGTGHVALDGGIIDAWDLVMRSRAGSVGTMDVTSGTLILQRGNRVSAIQEYIDNGWITAYDGNGTLQLDYGVTNAGQTTLKATHLLKPSPADKGTVTPGNVELSWTLPDPCVPGQPVTVNVYFTDNLSLLEQFTDPAAIQVANRQNVTSVVVPTQIDTLYYWAVDAYIGSPDDPIIGPIFSFAADNSAPDVDVGSDIVTWLPDGARTLDMDATVADDGLLSPYTVEWTVVSEPDDPNSPDAVIADPSVEDTSITLSAAGEYVLPLEAFDGEFTSTDTVTINAYSDSCQAAQSLPDYVPFVGDLNGDCRVDDLDLTLLQENWLRDNSMTEDWF